MDVAKRFLSAFVFVAGLLGTSEVVFCALRPEMTGGVGDASDVTWAHAVNSRDALDKALAGPIHFLEADVSLGHVTGHEEPSAPMPIMAHPPETTSDISLETWLYTVVSTRPEKGVKLDFKTIDVLEPSLIILKKYSSKLNSSSLWLNADVLPGPINSSTSVPVPAGKFLTLCYQYMPNATLSTGWTTQWSPIFSEDYWHYGWEHVREMADVVRCRGSGTNRPGFTFPVRGIFASRSTRQLQWLLSTVPGSTLTVWSSRSDPLKVKDLLRIRASFPKDKVFYDVPEPVNRIFRDKKAAVDVPARDLMADDGQWMTFTKGQAENCSASTYARNGVIAFGKSLATAVLQKTVISVTDGLKITGNIKFFHTTETPGDGNQRLAIVLAEVSLFAKNASEDNPDLSISDTDVIWSAVNSSTIFTFQHEYGREESSCRYFTLDSSRDKTFQAWTVPCDREISLHGEAPRDGISEVSSRNRLVLPTEPFLLGFVSAGDEHVVVHDLKIQSQSESVSNSGSNSPKHSSLKLAVIASLLYSLIFFC